MSNEPDLPPGMRRYYLCFLRRGPAWTAEESPELGRLQEALRGNSFELKLI